MPEVTNQDIINMLFIIAPQFKTDDPAILQSYDTLIEALKCYVCESVFGKCYVLAFAYMLAHVLYLAQSGASIGGVSSLHEGGLSISFAVGKGSLQDTVWGRQYLMFLNQASPTQAFVTGGGPCCGFGLPFQHNFGSGWIRPFPGGGCGC